MENLIFRAARAEDVQALIEAEAICFSPQEAAPKEQTPLRVQAFGERFVVAEINGEIVGYVNGHCVNMDILEDCLYKDAFLHDPKGYCQMILGIGVLPLYRKKGIAGALLKELERLCRAGGQKRIALTCHDYLIQFYAQHGFEDLGVSESSWGGEIWHNMVKIL